MICARADRRVARHSPHGSGLIFHIGNSQRDWIIPGMGLVTVSEQEAIGTLTLNDPRKRNALSSNLINDLVAGIDALREMGTRVVILRAAPGAATFSAGHDVHELPTNGRDPLTYNDPLRQVIRVIQRFPSPVVALVEGGVWGGACEVVMSCDIVVAAGTATFAVTPAKLGVPYNIGGTLNLMQSVSLPVIKELLFRAQNSHPGTEHSPAAHLQFRHRGAVRLLRDGHGQGFSARRRHGHEVRRAAFETRH
jgi:hypothetical protein